MGRGDRTRVKGKSTESLIFFLELMCIYYFTYYIQCPISTKKKFLAH